MAAQAAAAAALLLQLRPLQPAVPRHCRGRHRACRDPRPAGQGRRDKRLDEVLGSGYGIFSGDNVTWATLRFTPDRARWVSTERWHPSQEGTLRKDGSYELKVPYNDDRELIMDIMKYGGDCTVIGPKALRQRVADEVERTRVLYQS